MSKQPKEISIDWPPERTIVYKEREELDLIIPLEDNRIKEEQSRYSIEVIENISLQEHGKFIVTDLEKGLSNIIDDEYLRNTIYIESMEKFNYSPKRVDISNGHILLTYGIGAGDGWNFPHLVFEYDFDSNKLEYKLLAFPFDSVPIEIIYIG
jgi:hypothetical protein